MAARALGSIGVAPLSSGTVLAEVAIDEQHRRSADPAGARAARAVAAVWSQYPVDAATRAGMLDRRVSLGPVTSSAQIPVRLADPAATPPAGPDPSEHDQIGGIDRPRRDP